MAPMKNTAKRFEPTIEFLSGAGRDVWVPANQGHEQPFTARSGRRLLYVYNDLLGKHAYLDLYVDMILTDDEAAAHMQ